MPYQNNNNRINPQAAQNDSLQPQASPHNKLIQYQPDLRQAIKYNQDMDILAQMGKGLTSTDTLLQKQAQETALDAYEQTEGVENKSQWTEVSRNVKGMAKFNPYIQDEHKKLVGQDIYRAAILELDKDPNYYTKSPETYYNSVQEIRQNMYSAFKQTGLNPIHYAKYIEKFNEIEQQHAQKYTIKSSEYNYKRAKQKQSFEIGQGLSFNTSYTVSKQAIPIEQGNINLFNRPMVKNKDGSISTVRTISFQPSEGKYTGKEVLIPTVADDGKIMSDEEAIKTFYKSGRHFGIFETPEAATNYAQALHNQQADIYLGNTPRESVKSNIIQNYLNDKISELQSAGFPDEDIATIVLDGVKNFIVDDPSKISTAGLKASLKDLIINGHSISELIPQFDETLTKYIREMKRTAFNDKVLEFQEKDLYKKEILEQTTGQYFEWLFQNPNAKPAEKKAKAMELIKNNEGISFMGTILQDMLQTDTYLKSFDIKNSDKGTLTELSLSVLDNTLSVSKISDELRNGNITEQDAIRFYNIYKANQTDPKKAEQKEVQQTKKEMSLLAYEMKTDLKRTKEQSKRDYEDYITQYKNLADEINHNNKLYEAEKITKSEYDYRMEQIIGRKARIDKLMKGLNHNEVQLLRADYVGQLNVPNETSESIRGTFNALNMFGNKNITEIHAPQELRKRADGSTRKHGGTDVAVQGGEGVEIRNPNKNGVITFAGFEKSLGYYMLIRYDDGTYMRLLHLKEPKGYSMKQMIGQKVSKGAFLGRIGNTGASHGAHLHVDFFKRDEKYGYFNRISSRNFAIGIIRK